MHWSAFDTHCMQEALRLARRGQGRVEPNPMVGAVLARAGRILACGWHRRFGGPHAEIEALRHLARGAPRAHDLRGVTCYVTLEPCCHHGKTPPCTTALVQAGIARVVAAMRDPFPAVAGRGAAALRRAGIPCDFGLLAADAADLNAPYLKRLATGRPWVILKWAQSLDGKLATRCGRSKWITGPAARRQAQRLRGRMDAVMVGVGTVLADDPLLTCRAVAPRRLAVRVVFDSLLRTPPDCRLVRTARRGPPVLIFTTSRATARRRRTLQSRGCELCILPAENRRVPLEPALAELGRRGMTNVLVEGGARLLAAFFDARLADEAVAFIAPRLVGGRAAPGPLDGIGCDFLPAPLPTVAVQWRSLGPDRMCRLRLA